MEIWKDVLWEGAPTGKQISNRGALRDEKGKILRSYDNGAGYLSYIVSKSRNSRGNIQPVLQYAHRLVAQYFIPNPDSLPQVNHKDCDKSNNNVDNLEWISRKCNIAHAHKEGRMTKRSLHGAVTILTEDQVVECYTRVKNGEGVNVVAKSMDKPRTTISSIINKRSRRDITDPIDKLFEK